LRQRLRQSDYKKKKRKKNDKGSRLKPRQNVFARKKKKRNN